MTERELQQMADAITQTEEAIQVKQENLVETANALDAVEERNNHVLGLNRIEKRYDDVIVVQHSDYEWGVIDIKGKVIVPFGKYGWIDGFDQGLARVRTHKHSGRVGNTIAIGLWGLSDSVIEGKENIQSFLDNDRTKNPENYAKWGIINEEGEEVLPLIYDDIWNFLGKDRYSTRVELNGEYKEVYFHDLNPSLPVRGIEDHYSSTSDYDDYSGNNFDINGEGYFDEERLEDAFFSGEYLPEDW